MKPKQNRQINISYTSLTFLQRVANQKYSILFSRLSITILFLVIFYSAIFNYLIKIEGGDYGIVKSMYSVIITMFHFGYGDTIFTSKIGIIFSILIIITGIVFLLSVVSIILIKTFQQLPKIPSELPEDTKGHFVITEYNRLTQALIDKLKRYNQQYALLVSDIEEAKHLIENKIKTVYGELDNANTFKNVNLENAAFLIATGADVKNTNITYTARSVSTNIPIVSIASNSTAVQILRQAGCTHILDINNVLGKSLAQRIISDNAMMHIIGTMDSMIIAKFAAINTPLVGKTLRQIQAEKLMQAAVVGIWESGNFFFPQDNMLITKKSVFVLASTQLQIEKHNELFCIYNNNVNPILIIGGGNVGTSLAKELINRDANYIIIEKSKKLDLQNFKHINGDATDLNILEEAGFFKSPAIAITTHSDETNIYLATYFRYLRKDIQIISRATMYNNIQTLQNAGCDFVISNATIGANEIFNIYNKESILTLSEGVNVFKVQIPKKLIGKTFKQSGIIKECGCNFIGICSKGSLLINPYLDVKLPEEGEIIFIANKEQEEKFFNKYISEE